MKKNITIGFLVLFVLLAAVGIVMIVSNGTPYLSCLQWLSDLDFIIENFEDYVYATENIEHYATAYFTGITLLACGIEGCVLTALFAFFSKTPKSKSIIGE